MTESYCKHGLMLLKLSKFRFAVLDPNTA